MNGRKSKIQVALTLLLYTALTVGVATAQKNSGEDSVKMNLDKLLNLPFENLMNVRVITPTQSLQKSSAAPATVMVVTRDQIRLRGYRNLAEILNDLPDFMVNDKSDPQIYNLIGVRGLARQDFFVILLDGVRISSPTNEPLPILENFPIYIAKQIEIVYGPGSALYGADAMAGVINIITQKPGEGENVTTTVMGGTQGYSNASLVFSKKLKKDIAVSFAGQYSYDEQPDFSKIYEDQYTITSHRTGIFNTLFGIAAPQQPIHPEYEAPVEAYNVYASIEKRGFSMRVLHHYVAVPTSTTLKPDNAVYNKDVFYGQGITMGSASYTTCTEKLKSISTLVGSFYEVNPKSNFRNLYGGLEHGYKYSTGSMMKAGQQLHYSFGKTVDLTGGLTYELFQSLPKSPELQSAVDKKGSVKGVLLNSVSEDNPSGIEAKFFPLTYTNVGAYLQAQYVPFEKLSFTAGVRYDNNSRFGSTINPRIGAVYHIFERTTLKTLYGTAFWAPSPHVSFESYGSFYTVDSGQTYQSAYWHLPNPGLEPITSQTFEVSLNQRFAKNFDATLTAYATQIDNLIEDVPDSGNTNLYGNKFLGWNVNYIDVAFNKGRQKNYGANLMVNGTFTIGKVKFNGYSSLSYLEGKEVDDESSGKETEQELITPLQFRLGLDGRVKAFHFSVRLLKTGKQRMASFRNDDPVKRNTLNGFSLVTISTGYTFQEKATFFVNVYNVLDQRYQKPLAWDSVDSPGSFQDPLRAIVGIRVGF